MALISNRISISRPSRKVMLVSGESDMIVTIDALTAFGAHDASVEVRFNAPAIMIKQSSLATL